MLTECPACKGPVRLGEKGHHLEHECPERSLSCRHCRAPCCLADMKVRARLAGSGVSSHGGTAACGHVPLARPAASLGSR